MHAVDEAMAVVAATCLAFACGHDVCFRTVPNWVSAAIAVAGLVGRVADGTWPCGLLACAATSLAAILMWWRGYMGGADAKLLGACALAVHPWDVVAMATGTALSGAGLALSYLAASRVVAPTAPGKPRGWARRVARVEARRMRMAKSLPYACAIAAGYAYARTKG